MCSYMDMVDMVDIVDMSPSTHAHKGTFGMLTRAGTHPMSNVPSLFGDHEPYGVARMTILLSGDVGTSRSVEQIERSKRSTNRSLN